MDFDIPEDQDPRRLEVKEWICAHPQPTAQELAEVGYVVPHWPEPWGLDANPTLQLIIDSELRRAGISRPSNPVGLNVAGPALVHVATPAQQDLYLPRLISADDIWCQLFSEPDAGSDLAGLSTRAVRDGSHYIVNGQKIWTSQAHDAKYGILLAVTAPELPPQQGISFFICPMELPGITIQPITDMTGAALFNQVFLDDVRIPVENRLGEENAGWQLAKVTLANERVSLSREGSIWGEGPTAPDLIAALKEAPCRHDPIVRQRLAAVYIESELLRWIRLRMITSVVRGSPPGPEASIRKALSDAHGKRVMNLAKDICGPHGMLANSAPGGARSRAWSWGFLFSPALTIGGGTSEVQRNIIAERVLGLPKDPYS